MSGHASFDHLDDNPVRPGEVIMIDESLRLQDRHKCDGHRYPLSELPTDYLFELLLSLRGLAGIRSFDKLKGNTG